MMEFRDWFWEKFEDWRKGTTKGPTAFARHLGVKQQMVTAWLNGDYKPRMESITQLARFYPDIYSVLGLDPPPDLSGWPEELRPVVDELVRVFIEMGPPWDRAEVVAEVERILKAHGAKDIEIKP